MFLERWYQVVTGRCTYLFSRGDAVTNGMFTTDFPIFRHSEYWNGRVGSGVDTILTKHTCATFSRLIASFSMVLMSWLQKGRCSSFSNGLLQDPL